MASRHATRGRKRRAADTSTADDDLCMLCEDAPRSVRLLRCNHCTTCDQCTVKLIVHACRNDDGGLQATPRCPICNALVERVEWEPSATGKSRDARAPPAVRRMPTFAEPAGDGLSIGDWLARLAKSSPSSGAKHALVGWRATLQDRMVDACRGGLLELARALKAEGAGVSVADTVCWTPFHHACCEGHLDLAKWLHSEGADLEAPCEDINGVMGEPAAAAPSPHLLLPSRRPPSSPRHAPARRDAAAHRMREGPARLRQVAALGGRGDGASQRLRLAAFPPRLPPR